jgi:hypothetical protein
MAKLTPQDIALIAQDPTLLTAVMAPAVLHMKSNV